VVREEGMKLYDGGLSSSSATTIFLTLELYLINMERPEPQEMETRSDVLIFSISSSLPGRFGKFFCEIIPGK
jgi:hypothetical protein